MKTPSLLEPLSLSTLVLQRSGLDAIFYFLKTPSELTTDDVYAFRTITDSHRLIAALSLLTLLLVPPIKVYHHIFNILLQSYSLLHTSAAHNISYFLSNHSTLTQVSGSSLTFMHHVSPAPAFGSFRLVFLIIADCRNTTSLTAIRHHPSPD